MLRGRNNHIFEKCSIKFHSGHFNTYPSCHCNGICIWRRIICPNLQSRAFYWGWGSLTILFTFAMLVQSAEICASYLFSV